MAITDFFRNFAPISKTKVIMNQEDIILQLKKDLENAKSTAAKALEERDAALQRLKDYEEKIEKAEKASKMKSLFLANMSHEIRTPLNAIEGFSRVIAETDSPSERMKFLEIVESNNNRLLSLINEILDLSRVESGEITMKITLCNLTEICNNIKQIFKFRCPENLDFKADVPSKSVLLKTDPNRLTQVFSNLISNALKHTIRGGITYGYKVDEINNQVVFYVSDTGSGIDPKDWNMMNGKRIRTGTTVEQDPRGENGRKNRCSLGSGKRLYLHLRSAFRRHVCHIRDDKVEPNHHSHTA